MFGFPLPPFPGAKSTGPDSDEDEKIVVLINTFVVPKAMEEPFLAWWRLLRPIFAAQPGFVSARLHRSLDENERYRFINVAEWRGSESYRKALSTIWSSAPRPRIPGLEWHPALYEVIESS